MSTNARTLLRSYHAAVDATLERIEADVAAIEAEIAEMKAARPTASQSGGQATHNQ